MSVALTDDVAEGSPSSAGPRPRPGRRGRIAALVGSGVFITAYYTVTARALDGFQMHNDLGIQYYLARLTSRGAVPLIDFEHGWNTASWYLSALLYRIADGNPSTWVFLWGRGGFILAGLAMLVIAWRVRLPPAWILGLTATWIVLTHVPHNKYAVPLVWVAILLPAAESGGGPEGSDQPSLAWPRALRVAAAATVFWAHVELAVLLAIGTAMFDLLGARHGSVRRRLITAVHAPVGVAVGLVTQMVVYAALGLSPRAFLTQAIGDWTVTDFGPLFDFPLGTPNTIRMLLFPIVLLVPFVPLLWRRLSDPTRLLAMCNLAMGLIAIRRPGDGHVAAGGTLMATVLVLGAHDLASRRADLVAALRRAWQDRGPAAVGAALLGAAWYLGGLLAGFRIASFLAIVALTLVCLAAVMVERRTEATVASVVALGMAVTLGVASVGNQLVTEVRRDRGLEETQMIGEAVRADLERCAAGGTDVWIVPSPLTLYDELEVTNPTPFYAFWYNFEGQHDRLLDMIDDRQIPVIMQVGSWPQSMQPVLPQLQQRYTVCAQPVVEATGQTVTLWRHQR
ncbi:MAG TPA: hypothetical protein VMM13_16365 [Euzebya sp.]|nr:hypothetical protein [Euzebya sp.]